jgi:hypothetical protein
MFFPLGITRKHKRAGSGTKGFCAASQDGTCATWRQINVSCTEKLGHSSVE